MGSRGVVAAVLLAVAAVPGAAGPAVAHGSDPAIRSVLDEVVPSLPQGVRVSVETSVAAEVVVTNPTDTPFEALDESGRVFLRVSSAGVEADVSSPAFVESSAPPGAAAAGPAPGPARFVRLSPAAAWSWFDHRLHPADLVVPRAAVDAVRPTRLARWTVPLRYGTTAITLRGHVEYRRPRGRVVATVRSSGLPAEIQVGALEGRVPGLFVRNPTEQVLRVLGTEGETFAEITSDGVRVDTASPVHVADRRARGEPVAHRSRGLTTVSTAPAHTWLDPRLRPPDGAVSDEVERRRRPTTLVEWRVPYVLGSVAGEVVGTTTFVPFPSARSRAAGNRRPVVAAVLGAAAVAVVVLSTRQRRRVRAVGRDVGRQPAL